MRSRILSVLLPLLLVSTAALHAQGRARIVGRVVDGESGEALGGATVTVTVNDELKDGDVADAQGEFEVDDAPSGVVAIAVRTVGYETYRDTLELEEGSVTTLEIEMIGLALNTDPVVVVGQSVRRQRRMVGTATLVDPKTIRLISPIGTQEMLAYVPGVNGFADDGMGNSRLNIGMRGLNPRRSSRVLILEDGIPIQPALYVYPNMYYNPPTERIERVEVLKGSAAIEYGPQTMGGVINYITSRPRSAFGGRAEVTGGMHGYGSAYAEIGGFGSSAVMPEVQLLVKRGDGYRENNAFEQINGTLKLLLIPDERHSLYVKINGNAEETQATYTGLTEYSFRTNPTFNPKEDDIFTVKRLALDLIYTHELSDNVTSVTKGYANVFDRRWWRENDVFYRAAEYEADPATATPVPWYESGDLIRAGNGRDNMGIIRRFNALGIEQSYNVTHTLAGYPLETKVGGRLHWERFKDDQQTGAAPDARDGLFYTVNPDSTVTILGSSEHYETTALSLFAREGLTLGDLTLTLGGRLELFEQEQINRMQGSTYSDRTSMVIMPGIGVNYELGSVNFFAGAHRGYTPPSSGTLAVLKFGARASSGGLDLESEKSWNLEAGFRALTKYVGLELSGFHIAIEDMVAAGRGTVFRNLGKVNSTGIETAGKLRGSSFLSALPDVNFSYTFLRTEIVAGVIPSAVLAGDIDVDISGNELPYAPHHTLTAGLEKEFAFGLSLRADAHYVSESFTDFENVTETSNRGDTGPIPAITTFSASGAMRVGRNWTISLTAKNLTDEIYIGSRLHSNPRQPGAAESSGILPGPRRQVNLGVTYRFGNE